ncbi:MULTISPECIES: rod-binding protein [Sneathiella]|jgi:flagellar protein FlgJ|uniref:rod-binding protein n=1 Tax=Sneathiella TaxID=510690 RepID=UPI00146DA3BC|nr:rod-binding protein [Sneathiella aquimaris]
MTNLVNQTNTTLLQAQATANNGKSVNISNVHTDKKAMEAAQQFEAFFVSQILNNMSAGIETDDTFGGGESEKIFRSMLNDEYAKSMSKIGGIGVADSVYREILKMQEI